MKGKNVWEIEEAMTNNKNLGLEFLHGPSYMPRDVALAMGYGGRDEDEFAKRYIDYLY